MRQDPSGPQGNTAEAGCPPWLLFSHWRNHRPWGAPLGTTCLGAVWWGQHETSLVTLLIWSFSFSVVQGCASAFRLGSGIFPRCFVYEELLIVLLMRGNEVENDMRMTSPPGWCHSVLSVKISTSVKHLVEYQNNNIHFYSYMWILSLWAHCETNVSETVSVPLILRDNILLVFWHILVWFHFSMLLIKKLKCKYGWLWSYN